MLKINSIQSLTLDIIRVFAAQIVLFGYAISFFCINSTMPYIQNMGVVIFFILSGLIISYILIHKSKEGYSFKEFFIERFARIYSGLIPSLIFIAIIDGIIQLYNPDYYKYSDYDIKTFFANIFMLQDYYVGHYFEQLVPDSFKITSFGSGRPLWTLAIEWWIYMFMGLIYFFLLNHLILNIYLF